MVDALVSNTSGEIRTGSTPVLGTPLQRNVIPNSLGLVGKNQRELDKRYLRMAQIWAGNSYCKRRQVGALLVKDKMIISDGYNGTPSGFPNVCESETGETLPYVLHAEANAISKVAKSSNSSLGATLYVTSSPCLECAKLIIQAGIQRVVYSELYRLKDGLALLERAGIAVEYIPLDESEKEAECRDDECC